MNRDEQRARRSAVWRESQCDGDIRRLHARGLDNATIAIRLGVRISRIEKVLSNALDVPGHKHHNQTRRNSGTRPKGKTP